jgi:hypothetical protein
LDSCNEVHFNSADRNSASYQNFPASTESSNPHFADAPSAGRYRFSAPAYFVDAPHLPVVGRFDFVFAAEPAETPDGNPQRQTGILIGLVDPRHSFDLLSADPAIHDVLRLEKWKRRYLLVDLASAVPEFNEKT